MPELAEVETLKLYLNEHLAGQQITRYKQYRDNLRYTLDEHLPYIKNTVIGEITRRAKYINIFLDNNSVLTFHLGMSGRITVKDRLYETQKHDHIIIDFKSGKKLVFNDARRFGMLYISTKEELLRQKYLSNLGLEPLENQFNAEYLMREFKNKKISVKLAIMDNKILVGVGNIYAAESLHMAGINPFTPVCSLSPADISRLVNAIKQVLIKAIKAGGTTLRDFVNGDEKPGYFKQQLLVYDRENKPCYSCKSNIVKIKQAGRSTYFCPICQGDIL